MLRVANLKVSLTDHAEQDAFNEALRRLRLKPKAVRGYQVSKKSVDARDKGDVHFVFALDLDLKCDEDALLKKLKPGTASVVKPTPPLAPVKAKGRSERPVVIGLGPCGLFAALYLARAGLNPICLERGESVDRRAQTVETFFADGTLNIDSNVQFGEGGAGAFSDGKLTTGIKDPRCRQVLMTLVEHGAPECILYQAHPHVGTDKLPGVVASIREEIISLGGEVHFGARVTGFDIQLNHIRAVRYKENGVAHEQPASQVILAVGHSARDTFQALYQAGVNMQQKPFSVGVRIEHHQTMINRAQYGKFADSDLLSAAEYHINCRLPDGRGVYSFCMCPGGQVIAAASQEGGVCTNSMSTFARDGENANAALLVDVRTEDFPDDHPLSGLILQREWEQKAFRAGGSNYHAPVQRVEDFLCDRASTRLGDVTPTYRPGVTPCDLREVLPGFAAEGLKQGLHLLERQLHGIKHPDAVMTGVEARSSSPVRIPRSPAYEANILGLYPAGEGAGYAGGIMSAAVDGLRVAQALCDNAEL